MNLDPTAYILLAAVIAGVTELISRLRAKDYWVALTITIAALIGGLFGAFHYAGITDFVNGVAIGFGASGALTALSKFGNNTSAVKSNALDRDKV